jgi:hypothetical protein
LDLASWTLVVGTGHGSRVIVEETNTARTLGLARYTGNSYTLSIVGRNSTNNSPGERVVNGLAPSPYCDSGVGVGSGINNWLICRIGVSIDISSGEQLFVHEIK